MLARQRERPFRDGGWIFELKYDGYRTIAARTDAGPLLLSRNGHDLQARFPEVARAVAALPGDGLVLDGELVVLDAEGRPSFQGLQKRAQLTRRVDVERGAVERPATLYAFDLLAVGGHDLRSLPLVERKRLLRPLLPPRGLVRFADDVPAEGEALFAEVRRQGLEGIMAKRAAAPYRGGRSEDWLKIKAERAGEFWVVGWSAQEPGQRVGSLDLVAWREGEPVYAGRVGSGLTEEQQRWLAKLLPTLARVEPALSAAAAAPRDARWVAPRLVAEVRYKEWTEGKQLRQPVLLDLREEELPEWAPEAATDAAPSRGRRGKGGTSARVPAAESESSNAKGVAAAPPATSSGARQTVASANTSAKNSSAKNARAKNTRAKNTRANDTSGDASDRAPRGKATRDASRNRASAATTTDGGVRGSAAELRLSNLDKVYWPEEGYTKGDLIAYYRTVAPWMLPYLRDRPVVLDRYPDGIAGKSFYQKNAPEFLPAWIPTISVWSEESGREIRYPTIPDEEALLLLVNLGTIPFHLWASRATAIQRPDWCILDLDPKGAPFVHVVELARALHAIAGELELPTYVKTSGSSGLHVLIPLGGALDFDQSRMLGELLAQLLVRRHPRTATITRQISARGGKVYVDYLQNRRGQLLAAPWCVRPLPGAPVSTPLHWSEVTPRLDIRRFTLRTVPRRLRRDAADPLAPVLEQGADVARALAILADRSG
jgi:bifunctional non-homologous end joining protein LigD